MAPGDQLDFSVDNPLSYLARKNCRYLLNVLHK